MRVRIVFLIVILLVLSACSPGTNPIAAQTQAPTAAIDVNTSTPEAAAPTIDAPTSTSSPAGASSACSNPYMPVVVGATWNYKLTGPAPDTFTHTVLSVEETSFVEQDVFSVGVTRQGTWNCENGNLIALDPPSGASASVNTENNVAVDFQTTNVSGVTLPAAINPGDTWSQSLTLEGTQSLNGTDYPVSNQLTSDCKAIGMESVTVEAGTFDAMRVECQTSMKLSIQLGETPAENTLNLGGTNWYVQGVGLVKTLTTGLGFDSTVELVSYNIP